MKIDPYAHFVRCSKPRSNDFVCINHTQSQVCRVLLDRRVLIYGKHRGIIVDACVDMRGYRSIKRGNAMR